MGRKDLIEAYKEVRSLELRPHLKEEEYLSEMERVLGFFETSKYHKLSKEALQVFKALDNEIRLKIIIFLMIKQTSCLCELISLLKIDASTLTYHVSLIQKTGLIGVKKRGKSKIIYLSPGYHLLIPPKFLVDIESQIREIRNKINKH